MSGNLLCLLLGLVLVVVVKGEYRDFYYNSESCANFLPHLTSNGIENGASLRRIDASNAPYRLLAPSRYRRKQDITVSLESTDTFEAFLLQARSVGSGPQTAGDTDAFVVGHFWSIPPATSYMLCHDRESGTVVDKGRPILFSNLTFSWKAPSEAVADIQFTCSVLKGNSYWILRSKPMNYNPFPIGTQECGTAVGCFRLCAGDLDSGCSMEKSPLVAAVQNTGEGPEQVMVITLGGKIANKWNYVAMAFGEDPAELTALDIMACYANDEENVVVGHFFLEEIGTTPYQHAGEIELEDSYYDGQSVWCRFRRPVSSSDTTSINMERSLNYFFFVGNRDEDTIYIPGRYKIQKLSARRNVTDVFNEIRNGATQCGPQSNGFLALVLVGTFLGIGSFLLRE